MFERGVVLGELVLAVAQGVQDAVEVALRRLVLAEVVGDLVAERHHAEELLGAGRLLRVEVLDGAAQLEQRRADLRALGQAALLQGLDRRAEQPVRGLGRRADVAVAHRAHVGRLRGELGRAGGRGHQRLEVAVDLGVQPGQGGGIDGGGHPRGGGGRHGLRRRRRGEGERGRRRRVAGAVRAAGRSSCSLVVERSVERCAGGALLGGRFANLLRSESRRPGFEGAGRPAAPGVRPARGVARHPCAAPCCSCRWGERGRPDERGSRRSQVVGQGSGQAGGRAAAVAEAPGGGPGAARARRGLLPGPGAPGGGGLRTGVARELRPDARRRDRVLLRR